MLKQYSDNMSKSMRDLLSINAGTLEQLSQQQTALFTGLISDGITYADSLSKQKEYAGWISVSQAYTESVRARMLKSMQDSYSTLSSTNRQTADLMKVSDIVAKTVSPKLLPPVSQPEPQSGAKPQAKTATKPTTKPKAKPAAAARPKASAKTSTKTTTKVTTQAATKTKPKTAAKSAPRTTAKTSKATVAKTPKAATAEMKAEAN